MMGLLLAAVAVEHLIATGKFRQALDELARQEKSAPWHVLASKAWDGLGDPKRAVEEAESALALAPRFEAAHVQLGTIFLTRNTPQAASEIFSEARRVFPDSVVVRLGHGLALKELQRWDEAEAELAACWPNAVAFDALGTILAHRGRFDDLKALAGRFIRTTPLDWRGYYYRAAARDGLLEPAPAVLADLAAAIEKKPDAAAPHALAGKVHLREGRLEDAVTALERAVKFRPDLVQARLHLAQAFQKLRREPDAAREFEAVRRLKEVEQQPRQTLLWRRGKRPPQ